MCLPGEGELLFTPLTHLEVVGSPHIEKHDGKAVVVLCVKVNINQKAQVIEEILSQRKQTIVGIAENVMKEVVFDLKLISDAPCPQPKLQEALKSLKGKDNEWFNNDSNLKESLGTLLSLKEETVFDFVENHFRIQGHSSDTGERFPDIKNDVVSWLFSFLNTDDHTSGKASAKVRIQNICMMNHIFINNVFIDMNTAVYLLRQTGNANLLDAASRGKQEIVKALVGIKTEVNCKDQVSCYSSTRLSVFLPNPHPTPATHLP